MGMVNLPSTADSCHVPRPIWTLGDTLRLLRKREGWTQQDLADKAGVGLRTVIRLESEEPGNYQKLSLAAIAGAFGGTEAELLNWDPGAPLPSKGVHVAEVERLDRDTYAGYKPGDIPLITEAQAGEGRILYEDAASLEAYTERRVSRPEGVTDKNAFAVMVKGDSMVPVFRPGRYVVVSPNIPVAPGDEVFVALTSGERLIKIARAHLDRAGWVFTSRRKGKLQLRRHHPDRENFAPEYFNPGVPAVLLPIDLTAEISGPHEYDLMGALVPCPTPRQIDRTLPVNISVFARFFSTINALSVHLGSGIQVGVHFADGEIEVLPIQPLHSLLD